MVFLSKLFSYFSVSTDADLSEDDNFKMTFSNVVNFFMLVHGIGLGIYALTYDAGGADGDPLFSQLNLGFAFFFIAYMVLAHVINTRGLFDVLDGLAIFLYFVVIFVSCIHLRVVGISVTVYPFIAIILHGRKMGTILSFVNALLIPVTYAVYLYATQPVFDMDYCAMALRLLCQVVCIFIYYVAIRWLSGLIYDRSRDNSVLTDEIRVKDELVNMLTAGVGKPIDEINEAATILSSERLAPLQVELVSLIRVSAINASNKVNAVVKASSRNIPAVQDEEVRFSIYSLVASLLKLYKTPNAKRKHTYTIGSSVPETLLGNSILVRQVLLNILDALDSKIGLADADLKISVNRDDVFDQDIVLRYVIFLDFKAVNDERALTASNVKALQFLELDVTRRIVESEGGTMQVNMEASSLFIEFTLRYKDAETPSLYEGVSRSDIAATHVRPVVLREAAMLFMTDDDQLWGQMMQCLGSYLAVVRRARTLDEAQQLFTNTLVNIVVCDLHTDEGSGRKMVGKIRALESQAARKVPILNFFDPSNAEEREAAKKYGFDIGLPLPFDAAIIRTLVCSFFI